MFLVYNYKHKLIPLSTNHFVTRDINTQENLWLTLLILTMLTHAPCFYS